MNYMFGVNSVFSTLTFRYISRVVFNKVVLHFSILILMDFAQQRAARVGRVISYDTYFSKFLTYGRGTSSLNLI